MFNISELYAHCKLISTDKQTLCFIRIIVTILYDFAKCYTRLNICLVTVALVAVPICIHLYCTFEISGVLRNFQRGGRDVVPVNKQLRKYRRIFVYSNVEMWNLNADPELAKILFDKSQTFCRYLADMYTFRDIKLHNNKYLLKLYF